MVKVNTAKGAKQKTKTANIIKQPVVAQVGFNELNFLGFELTNHGKSLTIPPPKEAYAFHFTIDSTIDDINHIHYVSVSIVCVENSKSGEALAKFNSSTSFVVVNFNDVAKKEDGKTLLPVNVVHQNIGIAIGVARGMFSMCIRDTPIQKAVFPFVNINDLKGNPN